MPYIMSPYKDNIVCLTECCSFFVLFVIIKYTFMVLNQEIIGILCGAGSPQNAGIFRKMGILVTMIARRGIIVELF